MGVRRALASGIGPRVPPYGGKVGVRCESDALRSVLSKATLRSITLRQGVIRDLGAGVLASRTLRGCVRTSVHGVGFKEG